VKERSGEHVPLQVETWWGSESGTHWGTVHYNIIFGDVFRAPQFMVFDHGIWFMHSGRISVGSARFLPTAPPHFQTCKLPARQYTRNAPFWQVGNELPPTLGGGIGEVDTSGETAARRLHVHRGTDVDHA